MAGGQTCAVPHILEERVATDGDAVDGISRPVAHRMPSGQTNRKQHAARTDEPTELNERSSLVDVMEYSHSGHDVERILLDLTDEKISDDVACHRPPVEPVRCLMHRYRAP